VGGSPPSIRSSDPYSRLDLEPGVATEFSFKGFTLSPGLTLGITDYSNSYASNVTSYTPESSCGGYPSCPPLSTYVDAKGNPTITFAGSNLFRKDADFTLDLRTPSLERVYTPPKWLRLGNKVKHVVEGEAKYEYVTGVDEFQKIIHFDQTDILSNTNQLTVNLTNRLYKKDKNGTVSEFLTWRLSHARYFDPTFGGAVVNGARNVVLFTDEFSPYTFLDGPRSYSPVSSSLVMNPFSYLSLEWRTDYDPLRHKVIDQAYGISGRYSKYFASVTETAIGTNPMLVPQANQLGFGAGYGSSNGKGWNVAGNITRDFLLKRTVYEYIQTSYNTDCCGFSFEFRHLNFGIRNENQYLFSFSVANIGTFGSLQKQGRIF
jgi:LPS-assembly protein